MKHVPTILVGALLLGCGDSESGSISQSDAVDALVDELELGDSRVIVYALPETVSPEDTITTGIPAELGVPQELVVESESWFLWVDDEPGARFNHPSRLALVAVDTGAITLLDARWWPVVNGVAPWATIEALRDPDNWAFAPVDAMAPRQGFVPPRSSFANTCAGNPGKALLINGWMAGEVGETDFADDIKNMGALLGESLGEFDVTTLENTDGMVADRVREWISAEGASMQPGETLVIYLNGHGANTERGGYAGSIYADSLARSLEIIDAGVEIIVVVDSCESGAFAQGAFDGVADLTITASEADAPSYADMDGVFWTHGSGDDPNENDSGGEWTSSLNLGLFDVLTTPEDFEDVWSRAQEGGVGFWTQAFEEAFSRTADVNVAERAGWNEPQLRRGDASRTSPFALEGDAPSCDTVDPQPDPDPDPDPKPDPDPDPDPKPSTCDPGAEALGAAARILAGDDPCDDVTEQEEGNTTQHSDGQQAAPASGAVDITHLLPARWKTGARDVEPTTTGGLRGVSEIMHAVEDFPCGAGDGAMTLCAGADVAPAEYALVGTALAADVPLDGTLSYQYGFVFDSDGDGDNNYEASPAYPSDFFDGSDLWYAVTYAPGAGWSLQVTDARGGAPTSMQSDARVIVSGNAMLLVAPRDDFESDAPAFRVTAFEHEGDWGAEGAWSGDVLPTVDTGLAAFGG